MFTFLTGGNGMATVATHDQKKHRFGFEDLQQEIVDAMCAGCGVCISACPVDIIKFDEKPYVEDLSLCKHCSSCLKWCPRFNPDQGMFRPQGKVWDDLVGGYIGLYKAQVKYDLPRRQEGGAVTELVVSLLEAGEIDGAILAKANERWETEIVIATTPEEVRACAGTKYTVVPVLSKIKEAVRKRKLKNLAIVGTGCQIEAARLLQRRVRSYGRAIKYLIGLFCYENFSPKIFPKLIEKQYHIQPEEIKRIDIKGKLILELKDKDEEVVIPLDEAKQYMSQGCLFCPDFAAEWADISAGAVGTKKGWTTLIVRTDAGMQALEAAKAHGKLEILEVSEKALKKPRALAAMKKKERKWEWLNRQSPF